MYEKIMVSVIMITYKHESYIAEAIEGVLKQECDFELELIIADDCSPDSTEQIVKEIINNHPNGHWIRYTKHQTNLGMINNFIWSVKQSNGKYLALCEGDDYWTDPLKLQKQAIAQKDSLLIVSLFAVYITSTSRFFPIENNKTKMERI